MKIFQSSNQPLYLVPTYGNTPGQVAKVIVSLPLQRWIYLGCDTLFRLKLEQALGSQAARVSIGEALEAITRRLRGDFLETIGKLAVMNSSPLWWSMILASKAPNRSPLYLHTCLMSLGRDLLQRGKNNGIAFLIESPAVLRYLQSFARQNGIPIQHPKPLLSPTCPQLWRNVRGIRKYLWIWRQFISRRRDLRSRGRLSVPPFSGPKTALLFTWVDARNVTSSGTYKDPHLGALPEHLRKCGYRIAYVPRVLNTVDFGEIIDRLKETGETFIFPEAVLSPSNLLRCIGQALHYRPIIPQELSLDDIDISDLIREHVSKERGSSSHATALTYYPLILSLKQANVKPERIFYTFEGHNWSQAMCLGARTYLPQTETIGFLNTGFTPMLLSVCTSPNELRCLPFPDRLVTNGSRPASELRKEGYPPERVVAGAAIRHAYLWKRPPATASLPCNGNVRILTATGIDFSDTVELVTKVLRAFSGRPGYEVLVKCHPAVDQNRVKAEIGIESPGNNVKFTDLPITELLPRAHLLFYTYTSVCFEALRYGVRPVFVRPENQLCMDQLDQVPECRWTARTPEEIRNLASQVRELSDTAWECWYERAQNVLKESLSPMTPKNLNQFVARINSPKTRTGSN